MNPAGRPRLLATDLDGTLLRRDHQTISPRTLAAFAAARAAGVEVLALSGRQPYSMGAILRDTPLAGHIVGSNGSVSMDLISQEVHFEERLELGAQRQLAHALLAAFPGAMFVSVRSAGNEYVAQHGYHGEQDPGAEHALWPVVHRYGDLDEVLAEPSVKLVVADPDHRAEDLLVVARDLAVPGCEPVTSGAPFLEVGRAGVSKASALARFCAARGIAASEVVAFGDNVNDAAMLQWAGHGVAMANAVGEALAVADEVTTDNEDDGVARVVERLLG